MIILFKDSFLPTLSVDEINEFVSSNKIEVSAKLLKILNINMQSMRKPNLHTLIIIQQC